MVLKKKIVTFVLKNGMGDEFPLVEAFGTAAKQNLVESKFFKISTSNLEHN